MITISFKRFASAVLLLAASHLVHGEPTEQTQSVAQRRPITGLETIVLTTEQIELYKANAMQGDNESCLKLVRHFNLSGNRQAVIEWLRVAYENLPSHEIEHGLAVELINYPVGFNRIRGFYLLRRSASAGYEPAVVDLKIFSSEKD